MSDIVLKVNNVSKQYRLGVIGSKTITQDFNRWFARIRGKEDPYLKVGERNDRSTLGESDYVWALQDIDFEVKQGEILGIIGKNGAGKSTLLKILSRVTGPTKGNILAKGRISSLLEVGTGFHPEMTGRENIYLNGAILGMTKKEIKLKINDIIEFSGCQRYIDTPVKRYSSGMTVRLAFAVAAHLEPDILIVDEVLAVGDAEFQKKAVGKMKDISRDGSRTVLFVSHNMAAVKGLCTRAIVLEHGQLKFDGSVDDALNEYMNIDKAEDFKVVFNEDTDRKGNQKMLFKSIEILNQGGVHTQEFEIGDDLNIVFELENNSEETVSEVGVQVKASDGMPIFHMMARDSNYILNHEQKIERYKVSVKDIRLFPGIYSICVSLSNTSGHEAFDIIENALTFEITGGGSYTSRSLPRAAGLFFLNPEWKKLEE